MNLLAAPTFDMLPIRLEVEAEDKRGLTDTASVLIRILDEDGPTITDFVASPSLVWEKLGPGVDCPVGPSCADVSAAITDRNDVARAEARWNVVFSGQAVSGTTQLSIDGVLATGLFTFGPDLVEPDEPAVMEVTLHAIDTHANTSQAGPITILHCDAADGPANGAASPAESKPVDLAGERSVAFRQAAFLVRR